VKAVWLLSILAMRMSAVTPDTSEPEVVFQANVTEVRPSAKISAFFPVPKGGCPRGWYEVEHTFFTGLDWENGCWSERLKVVEDDHKTLKVRKPKKEK
jgi:hypothetical protein